MSKVIYRGWLIEREEFVNLGYRTETGKAGKGRKCKGWTITLPETGRSKVFPTLQRAKDYIDQNY